MLATLVLGLGVLAIVIIALRKIFGTKEGWFENSVKITDKMFIS